MTTTEPLLPCAYCGSPAEVRTIHEMFGRNPFTFLMCRCSKDCSSPMMLPAQWNANAKRAHMFAELLREWIDAAHLWVDDSMVERTKEALNK